MRQKKELEITERERGLTTTRDEGRNREREKQHSNPKINCIFS
jgi:hypothetical protein